MRDTKTRAVRAAVGAALLFAGATGTAAADEGITTTISGYGTLAGTFTSDNAFVYRHDGNEFTGANEQFDLGLESRIGLQGVVDFGQGFSITAQELIKQRGSDEFSLGTEWLYVQYNPDSHWKLRLGRVELAAFLLSESRNIGYAVPWLRVPNDVYAAQTFQSLDGAQVLYHYNLGPVVLGLQGSFGTTKEQFAAQGQVVNVSAKNAYNLSATLEYGDLLLRVAQTFLNLPSAIPAGPTNVINYENHDIFRAVGLQYDNGNAIVLGEWTKRTENNIPLLNIPSSASTNWYLGAGWRFGSLTPMFTYSEYKPIQSLQAPAGKFNAYDFSVRYDVIRNVALKVQVTRAQAGDTQFWLTPNLASNEWVNVYTLGADFVF
jgi:hypothetical protein